MTTERAIELLHRLQDEQFDGEYGDERREALEMAVRALSGDGDLIYRQDAIDACCFGITHARAFNVETGTVVDLFTEANKELHKAIERIEALPSVQPEVLACGNGELVKESDGLVNDLVKDSSSDLISRQETIEYCAGNKTWHDEDRATGDTIYRQDAIDEVINLWADKPFGNPTLVEIKDCIEALPSALPFAQPERKKGKWISEVKGKKAIIDEYGNVTCSAHCSECGDWLTGSDEYACRGRYCPSCGADMRGESE